MKERVFDQLIPYMREMSTHSDGFTESANFKLNFRLPPGVGYEAMQYLLAEAAGEDENASFHLHHFDLAYQGEKNSPLVRAFLPAIRKQGGRPAFVFKSGHVGYERGRPGLAVPDPGVRAGRFKPGSHCQRAHPHFRISEGHSSAQAGDPGCLRGGSAGQLHKIAMKAGVAGQFRVEGGGQQFTLPGRHNPPILQPGQHFRRGKTLSISGARMNMAWKGGFSPSSPASSGTCSPTSKLSTWRPKALRSTRDIHQPQQRLGSRGILGEKDRPGAGAPDGLLAPKWRSGSIRL